MRIVGRRVVRTISFTASGELLAEGGRFNDDIHRLPTGDRTLIRKGVYRFNHEQAAHADLARIVANMAQAARERA